MTTPATEWNLAIRLQVNASREHHLHLVMTETYAMDLKLAIQLRELVCPVLHQLHVMMETHAMVSKLAIQLPVASKVHLWFARMAANATHLQVSVFP